MYEKLTLAEGDEPQLVVQARIQNGDGSFYAMDLTGSQEIYWLSKVSVKANDATGIKILGFPISPHINGNLSIQLDNRVTATAGSYCYKIRVIIDGKPRTIRYGPLIVAST